MICELLEAMTFLHTWKLTEVALEEEVSDVSWQVSGTFDMVQSGTRIPVAEAVMLGMVATSVRFLHLMSSTVEEAILVVTVECHSGVTGAAAMDPLLWLVEEVILAGGQIMGLASQRLILHDLAQDLVMETLVKTVAMQGVIP